MLNPHFHLFESTDQLQALKDWLGQSRPILAVDLETSGLDPHRERIRMVQLGDKETAWSIPWERWSGLSIELLDRYSGPIVFHNINFDARFLRLHAPELNLRWQRMHDTLVLSHLYNPISSHALKPLATRHVDARAASTQDLLARVMAEAGWGWGDIPIKHPAYWGYAALDTVLTAALYEKLMPEVLARGMGSAYDLEMSALDVTIGMELRGCAVDLEYCRLKRNELSSYLDAVTEWVERAYGFPAGSNEAIAGRLIMDGVILTEQTPTGKWKLTEEVLEQVDHPLANAVLKRRKAQKLISAYLDHLLNEHVNGRVHCNIKTMGARTGRMSITGPALQTLPRGKGIIRDAFVPTSPDHRLIAIDYIAQEMRMGCYFAHDEAMAQAFEEGRDLHVMLAALAFCVPEDEVTPTMRATGKTYNFSSLYGAGVQKMAWSAQVSEDAIMAAQQAQRRLFPKMATFMRDLELDMRSQMNGSNRWPEVTTVSGRHIPVPPDQLYKGVNYAIQGSCADVLKEALVRLDAAGLNEYMILPIHDEVLFDVPTDEVEYVAKEAAAIMRRFDFNPALEVSVSRPALRWGETK